MAIFVATFVGDSTYADSVLAPRLSALHGIRLTPIIRVSVCVCEREYMRTHMSVSTVCVNCVCVRMTVCKRASE